MDFPRNRSIMLLARRGLWQDDRAGTMARRFKAKAAVSAIKGEKTLIELVQEFDVHPNKINQWRDQLLEAEIGVFGVPAKAELEPSVDVKTLHAKIGELTLENDFYPGRSARRVCRRAQENDRSHIKTQHQPTGPCARDPSRQRLLSTASDLGRRCETTYIIFRTFMGLDCSFH